MTGCQGCRDRSERKTPEEIKEEQEAAKKEREKPTFEVAEPVVYPGQYEDTLKTNRVKLGHWTTTDFRITANKFPAQGDLKCFSSRNFNSGLPVEDTDYIAVSDRPFSLPKGETKSLESSVYLPRRERARTASVTYSMTRNGGVALINEPRIFNLLRPFEYHLVVLTNRPDSYGYVPNLDSIHLPRNEYLGKPPAFYNVVRTRPSEEPVMLPRQALNWTTIAYLVWDDLSVEQLDDDQQQAMLDWLHFGGQLILSGPDSLDKLKNSFLTDYLPATVVGTRNLVAEDFKEINEHWSLKDHNQEIRRVIRVDEKSPLIGVDFDMHPDATYVTNTGKIAAERAVGRGRIVISACSLNAKPLIGWGSFKSFFNGALLRKPSREFGETNEGSIAYRWENDDTSIFDPLLGSTLRFLSRDLAAFDINATLNKFGTPEDPQMNVESITGMADPTNPNLNYLSFTGQQYDGRYRTKQAPQQRARALSDHWHYGGFQHDMQSGTGGWNDSSGISMAARETLKKAAGITPPSSKFVFRMLAVYLLVLVPINWLIFRMIGRVEWAWIAAPFIAIGGAFVVARMASLDIGFVRSNSQVACLEVYSDYSRAHVAQYSALYTSLSTGYELELDNPTAQSLPLGDPTRNNNKQKTPTPVTLRKTLANRLEGFQVQSNSTGMLHTEMMVDLLGTFSLNRANGELRVANSTAVGLTEAAVIRRTTEGELQAAWLGDLNVGSESEAINFIAVQNVTTPWRNSKVLKSQGKTGKYWRQLEPKWQRVTNDDELSKQVIKVLVSDIKNNVPELARNWDQFARILVSNVVTSSNNLEETLIDYQEFADIVSQMEQVEGVNVSQMFSAVSTQLAVAPGEIRMIGVTNQQIGKNAFSPAATQTTEQTLVVVHLQRPKFDDAKPDKNALEDINGKSDLDWQKEFEEELRQEGIEDSEEDVTNEDENQK